LPERFSGTYFFRLCSIASNLLSVTPSRFTAVGIVSTLPKGGGTVLDMPGANRQMGRQVCRLRSSLQAVPLATCSQLYIDIALDACHGRVHQKSIEDVLRILRALLCPEHGSNAQQKQERAG